MFLPGESQGRQSLVGFRLWGHTESNTTDATEHSVINDAIAFAAKWLDVETKCSKSKTNVI